MNTTVFLRERDEALRVSKSSEERYNRLLANVTDYVYTVRLEGRRTVSTTHGMGCEAVTGYTQSELTLDPELWFRMIYAQDRHAVLNQAEQILNGETPTPIEHRIIHKDGSIKWIRNATVPRRDGKGALVGYDGFVSDITRRRLAEEQLGKAEERYQELLENLTIGVCRSTPGEDGQFLEVNAAMVAMVEGESKDEVMRHRVSDFYFDPGKRKEISEKLMRVGFLKGEELEFVSLKGRRFWGSVNALSKLGAGGLMFFDSVIEDITDRKRAEEALRSERILMRTVLDNLPDIIYAKDLAGRKTLSNRADFQLRARHAAPADSGREGSAFHWKEFAAGFNDEDRRVIHRGEPVLDREERVEGEHGASRWLLSSKLPLREDSGKIVGLVGIGRDITDRKIAQQALRESEERLALVIQGSNDGIWDWNLITNNVYFSARWKSMLGYEEHEIENKYSGWKNLVHPEDLERAVASIRSYLTGETPTFELEHRLRHKDGSYRWILARGQAQRDPDGKPVRLVGSHIDLTERKLAIEQLRKAYAELARNEEALKSTMEALTATNDRLRTAQMQLIQAAKLESVGTLAAGVAHEVKNPLQAILMGLDFLDRNQQVASVDVPMVIREMRDAVTRANSIISELLQLSAAREFDLRPEPANEVIRRALWLMNNEIVAAKVNVVLSLSEGLPMVRMDRAKMEQVLINLFINALQAMSQEGVLTISSRVAVFGKDLTAADCRLGQFGPGDKVVIIEVQDTGQGIAEAHLQRLFDPFFTTKPVGEGTGLGLSVVRQIVDMHGGTVEIRNAPEGGAVVKLVLKAG